MSRIGSRLISIPSGVTANITDGIFTAQGPKGQHTVVVHPRVNVAVEGETITVSRGGNDKQARALHGLMRMLVANAVTGVSQGFTKKLEMHGIGYRAQTDGNQLTLSVGFTHPVVFTAPEGISFTVEKNTLVGVHGIDKQVVGQVAANIRAVKKPEPYKGKGIRYEGEYVRRKAGKAAKAGK
ncbi:MAG TPA: 50S ribosomal protein L6 [Patescibacteria group bacterium]